MFGRERRGGQESINEQGTRHREDCKVVAKASKCNKFDAIETGLHFPDGDDGDRSQYDFDDSGNNNDDESMMGFMLDFCHPSTDQEVNDDEQVNDDEHWTAKEPTSKTESFDSQLQISEDGGFYNDMEVSSYDNTCLSPEGGTQHTNNTNSDAVVVTKSEIGSDFDQSERTIHA